MPLITVDARELFLSRLKGVTDPEKKRKAIGEKFIEVFDKDGKKLILATQNNKEIRIFSIDNE